MKRFPWLFVAAFTLLLPVAVMATTDSGPIPLAEEGGHWWKGILQGIWGGLLASLAGYAKNRNTRSGEHEGFGIQYLVQTCIFGAILGLLSGIFKLNPTDIEKSAWASPVFAGLTLLFEVLSKAIWRNSIVRIREMLADFKTGSGNPTLPAPPSP